MRKIRASAGFTLVELVMVIVIMGIIAATIAVFFKPAIDAYFSVRRRADLTDMADTALRRMGREVQRAVPNSMRQATDQCFEFVPIKTGGMYRQAQGATGDGSDPLDVSGADSAFDVLSPLPVAPVDGDFLVIGNQNTADVYATSSPVRGVVKKWEQPPPGVGGANVGVGRLTLAAATQFPSGYYGGRFFVVDQNEQSVVYVCRGAGEAGPAGATSGTGTLVRLSRNFTPGAPATCPAVGGSLVASQVASCSFVYNPNQGATQQSGFVWMRVELLNAGERVALSYGAHVSNVP